MGKKSIIRMLIDIAMTVLLFFCMSFQFMEQMNHEIFGTILLAVFILHHTLNWRWYKNLGKGKYTPTRILTTIVDLVILVDMICLMFSGMRMSGYVFKWMNLNYSMDLARTIHMTASHADSCCLVFTSGSTSNDLRYVPLGLRHHRAEQSPHLGASHRTGAISI